MIRRQHIAVIQSGTTISRTLQFLDNEQIIAIRADTLDDTNAVRFMAYEGGVGRAVTDAALNKVSVNVAINSLIDIPENISRLLGKQVKVIPLKDGVDYTPTIDIVLVVYTEVTSNVSQDTMVTSTIEIPDDTHISLFLNSEGTIKIELPNGTVSYQSLFSGAITKGTLKLSYNPELNDTQLQINDISATYPDAVQPIVYLDTCDKINNLELHNCNVVGSLSNSSLVRTLILDNVIGMGINTCNLPYELEKLVVKLNDSSYICGEFHWLRAIKHLEIVDNSTSGNILNEEWIGWLSSTLTTLIIRAKAGHNPIFGSMDNLKADITGSLILTGMPKVLGAIYKDHATVYELHGCGFSADEVDLTLNHLDAVGMTDASITLDNIRTTASDAAVTALAGRGCTVAFV